MGREGVPPPVGAARRRSDRRVGDVRPAGGPDILPAMPIAPRWTRWVLVAQHRERSAGQGGDAGVPVAVGTDSGASSFNVPMGWGTHHELALYVDAGLTPMQALVAATRTEAELLSGGPAEYGTLEPGKMADLLLLAADPLADVRNTRAIERVMQAGVWLDRAALMPLPE